MWLFFAIASIFGPTSADLDFNEGNDTIVILESVEIHAEKHEIFSGSSKTQSLDSGILRSSYNSDFASVLSSHTPVSIKSYGPGILSTSSLRGGSASHTAFIWNGFNLQSPMNAQNDFSLIPVSFADEMQVQYGGESAIWGTGAVSGAVIMNNKPDFGSGYKINYHSSANTNENFRNSLKTQWSNEAFSTSLRLFHNHSKNKYRYTNTRLPDNPELKQKHAGFEGWGILQENHFKPDINHTLSLRTWYQQYQRSIPPTLFQDGYQATQEDDFLRIAAHWQGVFNKLRVNLKTGYFDDYLYYNDDVFVDSESRSKTQNSEAELRYYSSEQNIISLSFNHKYNRADADDYSIEPTENLYTIMGSWRWKNSADNITTSLNFRQKFAKDYDVEPTPSMGITFIPFDKFSVSANIGNTYRLPTLNDRYWTPGGNPDLKPESGWTQDINLKLSELTFYGQDDNSQESLKLDKISLALFHRKMNNWISWVPDGTIWSPKNIKEVRSYGTEINNKLSYKYGDFSLNMALFYSWTKSVNEKTIRDSDATIGKQLTYTPEHKAGININLSKGAYSLSYNHNYTGKRYTTGDNSRWLDPYHLADIRISYNKEVMETNTSFFIKANNIFDQDYEIMQSRPMPLRYFQAGVSINYKQY